MTTLGLGFGMAGSLARDSLTGFDTGGSQQQPAGSATFSGVLRGAASAAGLALGLGLGVRDAAGVDLGRGGTAAASRGCRRTVDGKVGRAHARLRQDEVDVVRRRKVSGDGRHDRADLLVAGQHQEGRRAAIALDPDRVEARLRMGEFAVAVRRHRSAGVQVRVDQRAERLRALQPRIEVEPQLAGQVQVRALSGRDDDPVDGADLADAACASRPRPRPDRRRPARG